MYQDNRYNNAESRSIEIKFYIWNHKKFKVNLGLV